MALLEKQGGNTCLDQAGDFFILRDKVVNRLGRLIAEQPIQIAEGIFAG